MDAVVRVLTAAAIILLVHDHGQGKLVLAIWMGGLALSTGVLSAIMYRAVRPRRPQLAGSLAAVREGWSLFVNTAAVSMYTAATVFLLGFVVPNTQLAIFGSAERTVRAALRALSPITAAAYPRATYLLEAGRTARAQRLAVLALAALAGTGLLMALALFVFAPAIVDVLFGPGFEATAGILRILSLLLPLVAITGSLSGMWLLPRGLDRVMLRTSLAAGAANAVLALVVGATWGITGAAWVLVAIEVGVALSFGAAIRRRGLVPTRAEALGRA
jgi:PST family polysaccharide transporter